MVENLFKIGSLTFYLHWTGVFWVRMVKHKMFLPFRDKLGKFSLKALENWAFSSFSPIFQLVSHRIGLWDTLIILLSSLLDAIKQTNVSRFA